MLLQFTVTHLEGLGLVSVHEEPHQLVLLVGLQHDVGHRGSGRGHADLGRGLVVSCLVSGVKLIPPPGSWTHLEEEKSAVKFLEGGVDAASVVIVQQQVHRVKLAVLLAHHVDVRVYNGINGYIK